MKLYYSPGACSHAPHILLREAGLDFSLEKVDLAAKTTESGADFKAINPHGYVPALQLKDGTVITEGPAIDQYIADLVPAKKLAPAAGTPERYKLQSWLNFISTELHKQFSPLFNKAVPDDYKAIAKDKILSRFDTINVASGVTLTVNQSSETTYAGAINGNIALNKTGTGIQLLSGSSNYNGGTTIAGGILNVNSDSALERIVSANSRCSGVRSVSRISPVMPMTPFIGVRISWLMFARN